MHPLNRHILLIASAFALSSCGGGGDEPSAFVYRSLESHQCTGGGRTLSEVQAMLVGAGVSVRSAQCGNDGIGRPAVCGADDGRIGIFEIPQSQSGAASSAGFPSVSGIPYTVTPCS